MLILSSATVFAVDIEAETVSYDLSELFKDYHEYSLDEMVKFIADNKKIHSFVQYFRDIMHDENMIFINAQREGEIKGSERHPDPGIFGIDTKSNYSKYLLSTARVIKPNDTAMNGLILLGERGNRLITVEINKSLKRALL